MEKASTFHSPTTPPTDASQDPPNPGHRKKRSHTVTLPRLPFHRHSRSNHSTNRPLASPTAPPSLPFRKPHTHLHDAPTSSKKTSSPLPSRRPSTSVPAPLHDRLYLYPPNISLLPSSSLPVTPQTLSESATTLATSSAATASSLASLNAKAHASTRRLDEVYYALLTRASALQDLVSRLRQLHGTMETGRGEFVAKAREIETSSKQVVDSWDGFRGREKEVQVLVGRLTEARERGRKAEERLVELRERVEGWDAEEKRRGRKRGWWFRFGGWVGVGLLVVLVGGLAWRGVPGGFEGVDEWGSGWERGKGRGNRGEVGIRIAVGEEEKRKEEERGRRWDGLLDEL